MQTTKKILVAAAMAMIVGSSAQAEIININGYTGSSTLNTDSITSWELDRTVTDSSIFISAEFSINSGTISSNDFFGVFLGGIHHPGFGIRGQNTGNLFARPQYSQGAASTVTNAELAQNQLGSLMVSTGSSFTMLANFYKTGGTASSVYDGVRVWFNPTTADTASSWDYAFTRNTGSQYISSFSSIGVRGANVDSGDSVSISNLAVGTSFADVSPVPEASSLAMLLAGLGMMGVIARRRIG